MRVVETIPDLREALAAIRRAGRSVGFVPTMGNLHAGHTSLIDAAANECAAAVVSIFVNPTQFGPGEDYQSYPRTVRADTAACDAHGAELVFCPSAEEMYPEPPLTTVGVSGLTAGLCGSRRPGHFDGVCTVVAKLLHLVGPDWAYFGAKDFQQSVVVRRMVRDLNIPCGVAVLPTVREADGLAMSSRNAYLQPEHRRQASALSTVLRAAAERIETDRPPLAEVDAEVRQRLRRLAPAAELEYLEWVDPDDLTDVEDTDGPLLGALAARFGTARLIDNILVGRDLPIRQPPR